jgi:alpha-beta hydrolase superfamily lysophospholipase
MKCLKKGNKIMIIIILSLFLFILFSGILTISSYNQSFKRNTPRDNKVDHILKNYPDLNYQSVKFKSNKGQFLKGYIYYKENKETKKGIIVISHGLGGTHINYIDEINYFANRNYFVFGFDNTGCGESDGDSIISLFQAVIDLNHALKFIEKESNFKSLPIFLFGHSWGGYAVCSILLNSNNILGVVSCSGFNSPFEMIKKIFIESYGFLGKIIFLYIDLFEKIRFGKLTTITAIDGINKTTIPILIMHSKDDKVVKLEDSILEKCKNLNKTNVIMKLFDDKEHWIFISNDARKYNEKIKNELKELIKNYGGENKIPKEEIEKFKEKIDYKLASEVDQDIMNQIVEFFDKLVESQN